MKRLVGLLLLAGLVVGCGAPQGQEESGGLGRPSVWHDETRGVTCWLYNGISCLPDSAVRR